MKRVREEEDGNLVIVRKALEEASVDIHRELAAHIGYRTSVAFKSDDGRPKTINASGDKQAPLDVVSDRCVEVNKNLSFVDTVRTHTRARRMH